MSQFPHLFISLCAQVYIECLPSKSNPENRNIKLVKFDPCIQGFKSGKIVIMVVLHVILRIKELSCVKIRSAMPHALNIYELLVGLCHFVKVLIIDPKQSTGRCNLKSVSFTLKQKVLNNDPFFAIFDSRILPGTL